MANPNAVLLYPTVLFEKILPEASAFNLHYLLHVPWAFLGARLLARRLRLSEGASFLAGAAFAFSGMMLSYAAGFANSAAAAAWLPWCAAAALELARASGLRVALRPLAALALALGLQLLAGEPALSLLTLVACAAIGLAVSTSSPRAPAPRAGRFLAGLAGAAAAAAALAAPLLGPLSVVLPLTYRGQHLYSERAFGASPFSGWRFLEWLFPRFSGDPGALGAGAHWQYALHPGDLLYVWCVTLGVVPIVLVALAAISRDFWSRPSSWLAAGGTAALLFAFGSALPFYRALGAITIARRLRYPIKFYLLTTLAAALLSGFALDHLARRRLRKRESIALGAIALFFVTAFVAAREGGPLERLAGPLLQGLAVPAAALLPEIRRTFAVDALLGLAGLAVVAAVLRLRPAGPASGYLLGFATLFFALPWGLPLFVSADERDLERPPALEASLAEPGRLYVSPRLPEFNVLATGSSHPDMAPRVSRLARVQIEELIPGTGEPFGVRYLFDADPDGSYSYYNRLAGEALTSSKPLERARLLRAFGGRWILAEEGEEFPTTRPVTGVTVAGRRLVLRELPAPLAELRWTPRVFRRRSLSGALELVRSEQFQPETDVALPGASDANPSGAGHGALSPGAVGPAAAAARVEADTPGYVVFSRSYLPAWRASVDGSPVPVLVANARDLAVAVPAGVHRVEFHWEHATFYRGAALQISMLLALAAAAARARPRS